MSDWRIDYDNDTGPGDGGFWEWWTVTDGNRSFRVDSSEADALWLKAALERAGDGSDAGDLSWDQRERTIAEGKRLEGLPAALQLTSAEREAIARRAVGDVASAQATALRVVDETLRVFGPLSGSRVAAAGADGAPAQLLTSHEKDFIATHVVGEDPVSHVTAVRVVNETLHAIAMRLEQPIAYGSGDGHWVRAQDLPLRPDKHRFTEAFYAKPKA